MSTSRTVENEPTVGSAPAVDFYQMFIDGEWIGARGGGSLAIVDPATEELVAHAASGGADEARAAVEAARRAFDEGPWPRMTAPERAVVLRAAAAEVRERADELARLETLQMGKLLGDSLYDMGDVAYCLEYAASLATTHQGQQTTTVSPPSFGVVVREPIGVVVGITPWNFPLLLGAWKFASALAAGNVVIIKPASVSPLTTIEMARIFDDVGLPRGVFQVVVGPGSKVGDYFCTSPLVDMVTLTGSLEVGVHIMRQAAGTVKKVGLELGGKSPNIVFADADFEAALQGTLFGAFANSGQVCCAGSRLILRAPDLRRVHSGAQAAGAGHQGRSRPRPELGDGSPGLARPARDDRALRQARHRRGRPPAVRRQAHRAQGLLRTSRPSSSTSTTACASPRRRSSGRCSSSSPSTQKTRRSPSPTTRSTASPAGSGRRTAPRPCVSPRPCAPARCTCNTYNWSPVELPWGGYKQSGVGRELGSFGIDEFTEAKSVIFDTSSQPLGLYTSV